MDAIKLVRIADATPPPPPPPVVSARTTTTSYLGMLRNAVSNLFPGTPAERASVPLTHLSVPLLPTPVSVGTPLSVGTPPNRISTSSTASTLSSSSSAPAASVVRTSIAPTGAPPLPKVPVPAVPIRAIPPLATAAPLPCNERALPLNRVEPRCRGRFGRFIHHPITSGVLTAAAGATTLALAYMTAGVITPTSIPMAKIIGTGVSATVCGYFARRTVSHMNNSSCTALQTVASSLDWIGEETSFEVFFTCGVIRFFPPWGVVVALVTTSGTAGGALSSYIIRWEGKGLPDATGAERIAIRAPAVVTPPKSLWSTFCTFINEKKYTILITATGLVLLTVGLSKLNAEEFCVEGTCGQYGTRLMGGLAGFQLMEAVARQKAQNPYSRSVQFGNFLCHQPKTSLGVCNALLGMYYSPVRALWLCAVQGAATGLGVSIAHRLYKNIQAHPLENLPPMDPTRYCLSISTVDKIRIVSTLGFLGGGLYFLIDPDNWHTTATSNADAGAFMLTIVASFYLTKLISSTGPNDPRIKQLAQFILQYCPILLISEYQYWNALYISQNLPRTTAQDFFMMLYNAAGLGVAYGGYRATLNQLRERLAIIKASPDHDPGTEPPEARRIQQILRKHFRGDILASLIFQVASGNGS